MPDALACIFRGPRAEAEVIIGVLESRGVDAMLSADDAGGWRPDVGYVTGTRVFVRTSDEAFARWVLENAEPLAAE